MDLSNTYLAWAARNLALNGFAGDGHRLVRADCLKWLKRDKGLYGLIFLDPPTFSNSKGFPGTFEVQRDHVELLRLTAQRLEPGGLLLFSNNYRRFRLDSEALDDLEVRDITARTIPPDFERTPAHPPLLAHPPARRSARSSRRRSLSLLTAGLVPF